MSDTQQEFRSPTDEEDLDATLHNINVPIDEDEETEAEIFEDVPTEYTQSYGTGVHVAPTQS